MMKKLEIMKNEILKGIAVNGDVKLNVFFECKAVNVSHYYDFIIDNVILNDDKLELIGIDGDVLTLGLSAVKVDFEEEDNNDYIFSYEKGLKIVIGII